MDPMAFDLVARADGLLAAVDRQGVRHFRSGPMRPRLADALSRQLLDPTDRSRMGSLLERPLAVPGQREADPGHRL